MPHSLEAEAAVLGAVLVENERLAEIGDSVRADDFYLPAHKRVFAAMLFMAREAKPIDLLTLDDHLGSDPAYSAAGGMAFISRLMDGIPRLMNVRHYAQTVRTAAERRRLALLAERLYSEATTSDAPPEEIAARALHGLSCAQQSASSEPTRLSVSLEAALDGLEARSKSGGNLGIPSGLDDLDAVTDGWKPGEMTVIAGRPSMGKSSLAMNAAVHAAGLGKVVCFVSLEMTAESLARRVLFAEAGVKQQSAKRGANDHEWGRLAHAFARLKDLPLYIDEPADLTAMRLFQRGENVRAKEGRLDMLVVDYLGLLPSGEKHQSPVNEVGAAARICKTTAKALRVPVLLLCQLNRGLESRTEPRPRLSDLRDSGQIEEHADIVVLIHRAEYYLKRAAKEVPTHLEGVAELLVAKNRNGTVEDVKVQFDEAKTTFRNLPSRLLGPQAVSMKQLPPEDDDD